MSSPLRSQAFRVRIFFSKKKLKFLLERRNLKYPAPRELYMLADHSSGEQGVILGREARVRILTLPLTSCVTWGVQRAEIPTWWQ